MTDVLTIEANKIINQAVSENKPFFLYFGHYGVHTPIYGQGDPRFLGGYGDSVPDVERHYAAMIESVDSSLGAVLDNLVAKGVANNTIVWFFSDNGGLSVHTRADTSEPLEPWKRNWHNSPLYSGKGAAYDGGYRVPMIIAWAGQSPDSQPINPSLPIIPGSASTELVISDDFFPTVLRIVEVGNYDYYTSQIDGRDLTPVLEGRGLNRGEGLYWHYPHQWTQDIGIGAGIEPFSAIRKGDWKLIYFYNDGVNPRIELYNLAVDISEQNNVADENHSLKNELIDELFTRLYILNAKLPVKLAINDSFPWEIFMPAFTAVQGK